MILNVHKSFIRYKLGMNLIVNVAVLLAGVFTLWCFNWLAYIFYLIGFVIVVFVLEGIYIWAYQKNTSVTIDDNRVIIRKGKLYYREIVIPLHKVYATIKKQNIMQKNVGLMTLEIQTTAKAYSVSGIETVVGEQLTENWHKILGEQSEVQR